MSELCKKTENGLNQAPCDTLIDAISYGLFEQQVFTLRSKNLMRVAVVTKKYKGKCAELSYCPFCGADIDTGDYGLDAQREQNNDGEVV